MGKNKLLKNKQNVKNIKINIKYLRKTSRPFTENPFTKKPKKPRTRPGTYW